MGSPVTAPSDVSICSIVCGGFGGSLIMTRDRSRGGIIMVIRKSEMSYSFARGPPLSGSKPKNHLINDLMCIYQY